MIENGVKTGSQAVVGRVVGTRGRSASNSDSRRQTWAMRVRTLNLVIAVPLELAEEVRARPQQNGATAP